MKLTTAERKKLPTAVFGLPENRKYPIPDKNHAKAALSRAAANATPAEQKKIRAKVHKLFPGIAQGSDPSKTRSLASMAM